MSHKISVKGLGPLENIEDFEVNKVNLVIGVSASGKSVLAKAIYFFNYIFFEEDITYFLFKGKKGVDFFSKETFSLLKLFFPQYHNYELTYTYKKGHSIFIKWDKSKATVSFSEDVEKLIQQAQNEVKKFEKNKKIKKLQKELLKLKEGRENLDKILDSLKLDPQVLDKSIDKIKQNFWKKLDLLETIFIPATRSFVSDFDDLRLSRMNHPSFFIRKRFKVSNDISLSFFSENYRKVKRRFQGINGDYKDILKGKILKDNQEEIVLEIKGRKQKLTIDQWSSGQKEALPIVMFLQDIIIHKKNSFLIIEEPEAHLVPKYQRELFEKIIEVINKTQSKVFITTHSPYLLMYTNNLLEAKKKKYEKLKDKFISFKEITVAKLEDGKHYNLLGDDELIDGGYIDSVADEIIEDFEKIIDSK